MTHTLSHRSRRKGFTLRRNTHSTKKQPIVRGKRTMTRTRRKHQSICKSHGKTACSQCGMRGGCGTCFRGGRGGGRKKVGSGGGGGGFMPQAMTSLIENGRYGLDSASNAFYGVPPPVSPNVLQGQFAKRG